MCAGTEVHIPCCAFPTRNALLPSAVDLFSTANIYTYTPII